MRPICRKAIFERVITMARTGPKVIETPLTPIPYKPIRVKPAWECSRYEWFKQQTERRVLPIGKGEKQVNIAMYRVKGSNEGEIIWQAAWDTCGLDKEFGHFWKILRQCERTQTIHPWLSPENLVEYQKSWMRFLFIQPFAMHYTGVWIPADLSGDEL